MYYGHDLIVIPKIMKYNQEAISLFKILMEAFLHNPKVSFFGINHSYTE